MSVTSHPARSQFDRMFATGESPVDGQPGSFAVNVADRKAWTFDGIGQPVLLTQRVQEHDANRAYVSGDLSITGDSLWVAKFNIPPGAFNPAQWTALVGSESSAPRDPAATGLLAGGALTYLSGTSVFVDGGSGVIVNMADPANPVRTNVAWPPVASVNLPYAGQAVRAVMVSAAGNVITGDLANIATLRRQNIILGYVVYDAAGTITSVRNTPFVSAQTSQDLPDLVTALGGAFKITGCVLSGAGGGTLRVSSGVVYGLHSRWRSSHLTPSTAVFPASPAPRQFTAIRSDGTVVAAGATVVPNAVWQGGALLAGLAAIHYLFASGDGAQYRLQLGQTQYPSPGAAESALMADWDSFIPALPPASGFLLVGAVIVQSGIVDPYLVLNAAPGPRVVTRFAQAGMSGEYMRRDGTTPMTGDLNMGGNDIVNVEWDEGVF